MFYWFDHADSVVFDFPIQIDNTNNTADKEARCGVVSGTCDLRGLFLEALQFCTFVQCKIAMFSAFYSSHGVNKDVLSVK